MDSSYQEFLETATQQQQQKTKGRPKKYATEEERKEAVRDASIRCYEKNKPKVLAKRKEYYAENCEELKTKNLYHYHEKQSAKTLETINE